MKIFEGFLSSKKETYIQIVLLLGILIALNYSARSVVLRLDVTDDQRYTLSQPSIEIAENMSDAITITAYFSSDLPPQYQRIQQQFRYYLDEFRAHSRGNIEYTFVNPNEDALSESRAQQAGITPGMIQVRERDQISQIRAYLGVEFRYGEISEVIPIIQSASGIEYRIASNIKKLTNENRKSIGILQGHGTPPLDMILQAVEELDQQYNVEPVTVVDSVGIDPIFDALAVIAPTQRFTGELAKIDQYIMRGGKVLFLMNMATTDPSTGSIVASSTGLEQLLTAYKTPVNSNVIRDQQSNSVNVPQQQGMFNLVNQIRYPYLPIVTNFADHPITNGLEEVGLQFVSSIDTSLSDINIHRTVLASSTNQAGIAEPPMGINLMQDWSVVPFNESNIPFGVLSEGVFQSAFANSDSVDVDLESSVETSIIVFGDGDFVVNQRNQQQQQLNLPEDNINLFINSIDYLVDDTGLITLRTKGVVSRPLRITSDSTKTFLKILNVFLPIGFVLAYGGYRYRRRQKRRKKWQESGV